MKFQKKPVIVEAIKCSIAMEKISEDFSSLPDWLINAHHNGGLVLATEGIYLPTLEGTMLAKPDDWIICGISRRIAIRSIDRKLRPVQRRRSFLVYSNVAQAP